MKSNFKKLTRRYVTLIEMMIVMFLIAMITGVIAYNYTGSLDEGRAFKTKTGMEKLQTILELHLAQHPGESLSNWQDVVRNSSLVKNADDLIKDGWGEAYTVNNEDNHIIVTSSKYNNYVSKKGGNK